MFCVYCYRCYPSLAKTEEFSLSFFRRIKLNIETQIVILSSFPQTNRKYNLVVDVPLHEDSPSSNDSSPFFLSLAALFGSFIRSHIEKMVPSEKNVQYLFITSADRRTQFQRSTIPMKNSTKQGESVVRLLAFRLTVTNGLAIFRMRDKFKRGKWI